MRPVHLPRTFDQLWDTMKKSPDAALIAGGTDLLVLMRIGRIDPPALICLERIDALKGVSSDDGRVSIGAASTHTELMSDPIVLQHFPVLAKSLRSLGSPHIRNMGTIGGNIMTASPAGDTLPSLYVLDAVLELRGREGVREVPIQSFIKGPGATAIGPGEILTRIFVPEKPRYGLHHYEKVGLRKALACAVLSFTAVLDLADGGRVRAARMAWGSAGPTVVTCPGAEAALVGERLTGGALAAAAERARAAVTPITDVRASTAYRKTLAGNLVLRLADYADRHWEGNDVDGI